MIRPHRDCVRRLRTAVRAAVRADPWLRAERRRLGSRPRITAPERDALLARVIISVMIGFGAYAYGATPVLLECLAAWMLAVMFVRAASTRHFDPAWLTISYFYPIGDAALFAAFTRANLLAGCGVGLDFLLAGIALALREGTGLSGWAGAGLLGLGAYATTVGGAWLCAWQPRLQRWLGLAGLALAILTVLQILWLSELEGPWSRVLDTGFALIQRCTPGGWFIEAWLHRDTILGAIGCLLVPLACAGAGWLAWQARRNAFSSESILGLGNDPESSAWGECTPDAPAAESPEALPSPAASSAATMVAGERLAQLLRLPPGKARRGDGPIEAWFVRSLSRRARIVLDLLQAWKLSWSRQWLCAAGALAAAWLLSRSAVPEGVLEFGVFLLVGLAALFALPLVGELLAGARTIGVQGVATPFFAHFPVTVREIHRLWLKAGLLRVAAAFPLTCAAMAIVCGLFTEVNAAIILYAVKLLYLVILFQPLSLISQLSSCSKLRPTRGWFDLLALLLLGLLLPIAGVLLYFWVVGSSPATLLGSGLGLGLIIFIIREISIRRHDRLKTDWIVQTTFR